jgi:hyperosmotically inducible protein
MSKHLVVATLALTLMSPVIAGADQPDPADAVDATLIAREVRHELTLLPHYTLFDWLDFAAQADGMVTLRGQVVGFTLRADAEDAIKRIAGVSRVVNQIAELPASAADQQIRRAAYRVIYAEDGPLFHYALEIVPTIHIVVANGHLTLRGVVSSTADRNIAAERARGVAGVVDVSNELTIDAPGTMPSGTA